MASRDAVRSKLMARIRPSDTKPEIALRKCLWGQGLRYRVNHSTAVCRVDICFPGPKVAVFVDGCFWHGCPEHYVRPRSRQGFWADKLQANVKRDSRQTIELERSGWTVLRYWEHEVYTDKDRLVHQISAAVDGGQRTGTEREVRWQVLRVQRDPAALDEWEYVTQVDLRDPAVSRHLRRRRHTSKW